LPNLQSQHSCVPWSVPSCQRFFRSHFPETLDFESCVRMRRQDNRPFRFFCGMTTLGSLPIDLPSLCDVLAPTYAGRPTFLHVIFPVIPPAFPCKRSSLVPHSLKNGLGVLDRSLSIFGGPTKLLSWIFFFRVFHAKIRLFLPNACSTHALFVYSSRH